MTLGTATVIQGDARNLPLEDGSVDLVCTSPPYFALRSYQDAGQHYDGQVGSEDTPQAWLENLWECTAEMMRVLKPEGSIFVNLGDKYAGTNSMESADRGTDMETGQFNNAMTPGSRRSRTLSVPGIRSKSLMGLPWRYTLGCIDQLGLILRAEIIWAKPNGLPESVTDRVRRSHEQWFHFVKQPRYYSAVDEIREGYDQTPGAVAKRRNGQRVISSHDNMDSSAPLGRAHDSGIRPPYENPLGKLPGSVWEIPTQPLEVPDHLGVDHFAAYPCEWPRRIITGWTPPGICVECGQGRRPVADRTPMQWRPSPTLALRNAARTSYQAASGTMLAAAETRITGYVCGCPTPNAPTRPALVVDPFGGTGTTALVAKALGRHGITIDLSHDYTRLAQWRVNNPAELAKAAQVPKPPPVYDGQLSLLEEPL